jgi:Kef-type K+ transport system membrane component KefB
VGRYGGAVDLSITSFLLIVVAAMVAPLLTAAVGRVVPFPLVVVELLLGILIGPQVLGLAEVDELASFFGSLGLAFLFLFAGYEIEFDRIRGAPLRLALIGWGLSLVLAYSFSGILHATGVVISGLLTGTAMATTAIGTLMPILRDARLLETHFGRLLLAAGAAGELGPILIITLVLTGSSSELANALVLAGFVFVVVITATAALLAPDRFWHFVGRSMLTSGQLPVRLTVALLIALVALAEEFGLDLILGAFSAGIIIRLVFGGHAEDAEERRFERRHREVFEIKLDAIGYGFAIPAFFITSGMEFDLDSLLGDVGALLELPLFLVLFLVIRGLPALLLYREELPDPSLRTALALFSATQLTLVVAITTIGVDTGEMHESTASALVGAAMLSTLIFPLLGTRAARTAAS